MFLDATVMQISSRFCLFITVRVPPLNHLTNVFILTEGENMCAFIYAWVFNMFSGTRIPAKILD